MWILRYVILASRNRGNANLDRRTRMTFDPLHGAAMHVCADKAEWDRRGEQQVAVLENELRQDIEAYNTVTGERRKIDGTLEVRPVAAQDKETLRRGDEETAKPTPDLSTTQGASEAIAPHKHEEVSSTLIPETISTPPPAKPEPLAAEENTGAVSVSSGETAQAESEPDAAPTSLTETEGSADTPVRSEPNIESAKNARAPVKPKRGRPARK